MSTTVIIVLLVAGLFIAIYEFLGIYDAVKKGLTKNKSRIITHGLIILIMFTLLYLIIEFVYDYYKINTTLP